MHLQLAPGLRVVRRGPHELQVGLYDRRLVLPRNVHTEHVLARLAEGGPLDLDDPAVASTVSRLVAAGCARPLRVSEQRSAHRAGAPVCLLGDDLGAGSGTGSGPGTSVLLQHAGLTEVVSDPARAAVVLVGSHGEVARELTDPLVRDGIAHLVVRLVDGGAVVGPFVVPGRTPCLRCIDARRLLDDPHHVPVLARYVAASQRPPEALDADLTEPALVALALAWAVRDLLAHVDGARPTTWGTTVRLGPEPSQQVQTAWAIDPECGCCWPGSAGVSGRMVG
jgi:bacteriocin biosynthesis cyclodehydratase domain-containing protein